jgi:hypothetical protein
VWSAAVGKSRPLEYLRNLGMAHIEEGERNVIIRGKRFK